MSLYYTPNVHKPHTSQDDFDSDLPSDGQPNFRPQLRLTPAHQDSLRHRRQHETLLNDGTDVDSIFIFPQPSSSTGPIPPNPYSSPRSSYSEDSIVSRPTRRRKDTETSRLSYVAQSEYSADVDGISTPTTTVTFSIGSSPISAFTDVDLDEGSVDDGLIEAMLWDWDSGMDERLADGPGEEFLRSEREMRPEETLQVTARRRSQVRPWPLQHGSGERLRALIEREQLRNRWREVSRSHQSRSRSYSPLSTPSSSGREFDLLSLAPHPRIKIPFLDFFASILGVDESTVDLLTRCSTAETHGSVLFPGHTIQPLPAPTSHPIMADEDDHTSATIPTDHRADKRAAVRGFHKALPFPGVERESWISLKEGLAVLSNTAALVPPQNPGRLLGLVQLWGLVSHVYARGGDAIKNVYFSTRTSASPSGIEEVK